MMVSYSKIGDSDPAGKIYGEFMNFVSDNEIDIERFFQMHADKLDDDGNQFTLSTIVELIRRTRYELFVSMSSWSQTTEGIEYWTRLSDNWEQKFSSLLDDYEEFFSDGDSISPKRFFFKKNGVVKPKEAV